MKNPLSASSLLTSRNDELLPTNSIEASLRLLQRLAHKSSDSLHSNPITGIAGRCARAESGHAIAKLKSRRRMSGPEFPALKLALFEG
jgi:hypothetical protein